MGHFTPVSRRSDIDALEKRTYLAFFDALAGRRVGTWGFAAVPRSLAMHWKSLDACQSLACKVNGHDTRA